MKQVLDRAQLSVPAGQRRLQPVHPLAAAHRRQHPGRPPQLGRPGLALQRMLPGIGEPDRDARQPVRRLIHQHRARLGRRLHPGCGIHRIPRDHPLTGRAQGHRDLAGHHPRPRRQPRQPRPGTQLGHRDHQIQRGSHGPLRVPLGGGRGAPHCHHRIADELLHHPAVPADHRPRHREVLRQQLPDRLRVPRLGQRGEPHHIAEQHRAHPPLRGRLPARPGHRRGRGRHGCGWRRGELSEGGAAGTAKAMPGNNRRTARRAAPHRSAAMPAEPVALLQGRTAPATPHATLPTLGTSALVKPARNRHCRP